MGVEAAIAASILLAGASTAYQVNESKKARKEAGEQAAKAEAKQAALEAEAADRAKKEESDATANRTRELTRARARASARAGQGGRNTLLTGPMGVVPTAGASAGGRTLLGG